MCREFKLPKWPKPGQLVANGQRLGHLDQRIHGAPAGPPPMALTEFRGGRSTAGGRNKKRPERTSHSTGAGTGLVTTVCRWFGKRSRTIIRGVCNWGRVGVGQTGSISGARRHASRRYVTLRTMKSMIMTLAWSCWAALPSLAISADSWTASAPQEIRPLFQREDIGGRSGQGMCQWGHSLNCRQPGEDSEGIEMRRMPDIHVLWQSPLRGV